MTDFGWVQTRFPKSDVIGFKGRLRFTAFLRFGHDDIATKVIVEMAKVVPCLGNKHDLHTNLGEQTLRVRALQTDLKEKINAVVNIHQNLQTDSCFQL